MSVDVMHSEERFAQANGIEICYDTFGNPGDQPLLLIMGLGGQMTAWRQGFCADLASKGLFVIRFDNRDVGRSTRFEEAGTPTQGELLRMAFLGMGRSRVAYKMSDMADDAVGLLDALGIAKAHIVGISMGGMIAQMVAIQHQDRVSTLISIMSSPGGVQWPLPTLGAMAMLLTPPAKTKEEQIKQSMAATRAIGSQEYPVAEETIRAWVDTAYDRAPRADGGMARQLAAILASGSREKALRTVHVPTLVIHGAADPLVRPVHGAATAKAISGAWLLMIDGMGHFLSEGLAPRLVEIIAAYALSAHPNFGA